MFFEFIKNHYELIGACLLLVASVLINLFKKRPVNSLMQVIYDYAIKAIKIVEDSNVVGSSEKLALALKLVHTFLEETYPGIKLSSYDSLIIKTIEEILETPQKKQEVIYERLSKKRKSRYA